VDARTGALQPLRVDPRSGLDRLDPIDESIETVEAFDGLSLPVITYLPRGALAAGNRLPVIVEFHGGPSDSSGIGWDVFARFHTALGYAFLEPNVRGSTGYGRAFQMADNHEKRADWLKDIESVNAWVKAQPWADPGRVIVNGGQLRRLHGADGAHAATLAVARGRRLRGHREPSHVPRGDRRADPRGLRRRVRRPRPGPGTARAGQPSAWRRQDHRTAVCQNDPRVPREESDQVVEALRARGVPVEYQVAANEGHSLDHRENRVEFLTRVARFLEDNARSATPSGW
jgi:dipeptidyl aminopeptidase/acylaminoacyl peptidase